MRKLLSPVVAVALGFGLSLAPAAAIVVLLGAAAPAHAQVGASHYELRVNGMACPFCAYGIEKKLKALPGAKDLKIDLEGGRATFDAPSDQGPTPQQVKQAVKDAGFTLGELKIDGKKVEG